MSAKFFVIAIDGKAASGKSSTAQKLAEKLNLLNVSTGEHYRAIACFLNINGIHADDNEKISQALNATNLAPVIQEIKENMSINGTIFNEKMLRSEEINSCVSLFSKNENIRAILRKYQKNLKEFAIQNGFSGMVIEGRDMTNVVYPDAEYKFLLHADINDRIHRRENDKQTDCITCRDKDDSTHMGIDSSVTLINTSNNSLDKVVDIILHKISLGQ